MAGTKTLKEQLDDAAGKAEACMQQLKRDDIGKDEFRNLVFDITLCKFFLTPEECDNDVIFDLAEKSIEKLLRMNDKSVKLALGSATCTNQSSTDIKKVLLSITLQRELGVQFTPDQSAELETTTQLADALFDAMQARNLIS